MMPRKRESWSLAERVSILAQFIRVVKNWYSLPVALVGSQEGSLVDYVTHSGLRIRVRGSPLRMHLSDCYSIVENFGRRKDLLLALVGSSDVVLDIGAHIGSFAVRAARIARKVLCFEPEPGNFDLLVHNLSHNRLENVYAFKLAITSQNGVRDIVRGPTGATATTVGARRQGFQVQSVSLSTAIELAGAEEIGLLKMDCEGAEYEIVRSTPPQVLRKVRRIFIELHHVPRVAEALSLCLSTLSHAGFDLVPSEDGDLMALLKDRFRQG